MQRDVFLLKVNGEDREVMVRCPTEGCSVLHGPGWEDLVARYDLFPGVKLVFTNRVNNRARMIIFREDGRSLTNEVMRRVMLAPNQPKHVGDKGNHCQYFEYC